MKNLKYLFFSAAVCLFVFCTGTAVGADSGVKIYVNGEMFEQSQSAAIIEGRTYVPVRSMLNFMGYGVFWNSETNTVTADNGSVRAVMHIGSSDTEIYTGGVKTKTSLDGNVYLINGSTAVPLRSLAENLGAEVSYNEAEKRIDINCNIHPHLYTLEKEVLINQSGSIMPKPDRIDISMRGLEWYVYNDDYLNYRMVAVEEGRVVGFFTNAKDFKTSFNINQGDITSDVCISGYSVKIYRDFDNNNAVSGILLIMSDKMKSADFSSEAFLRTQEEEHFDMVNSFRVANGAKILEKDQVCRTAARNHSEDMAKNNFFSHTGSIGTKVIDRYLILKPVMWTAVGENIGNSKIFACESFYALLNSPGHRSNILNPLYKYLGVGNAYGASADYLYYTTQMFLSY